MPREDPPPAAELRPAPVVPVRPAAEHAAAEQAARRRPAAEQHAAAHPAVHVEDHLESRVRIPADLLRCVIALHRDRAAGRAGPAGPRDRERCRDRHRRGQQRPAQGAAVVPRLRRARGAAHPAGRPRHPAPHPPPAAAARRGGGGGRPGRRRGAGATSCSGHPAHRGPLRRAHDHRITCAQDAGPRWTGTCPGSPPTSRSSGCPAAPGGGPSSGWPSGSTRWRASREHADDRLLAADHPAAGLGLRVRAAVRVRLDLRAPVGRADRRGAQRRRRRRSSACAGSGTPARRPAGTPRPCEAAAGWTSPSSTATSRRRTRSTGCTAGCG